MAQQIRNVEDIITVLETDPKAAETNARFDRIDSLLDDIRSVIFGRHFERAVRDELPARLGEVLPDSTKVRILVCRVDGTGVYDGFFRERVQRAEDRGLLPDPADRLRLNQTDLVLSAKVAGDTWMLPVEVSATIDNDDVSRAHRSAVLIRDIFATDSLPVVAGPAIRAATRQYAEREGVAVVILGGETRNQEPDGEGQTQ